MVGRIVKVVMVRVIHKIPTMKMDYHDSEEYVEKMDRERWILIQVMLMIGWLNWHTTLHPLKKKSRYGVPVHSIVKNNCVIGKKST